MLCHMHMFAVSRIVKEYIQDEMIEFEVSYCLQWLR